MTDVTQDKLDVGLIGVGALGLAVAERWLAAGHRVRGFRRGSLDALRDIGGTAATSAADVVASNDIVVLLLPSDAALHEVMGQIASSLRPGQVVLCLGTHPVDVKIQARAVAEHAGATLVDGEVSGTPAMLRNGLASVMVAGDRAAFERARPVLDVFAKATIYVGAFGNAAKMKLVTNYLVGVHTMAAAEALMLATHLGLDPASVVETIAGSAGGSTMLAVRGRTMVAGAFAGHPMIGFLRFFDLLRDALPNGAADHVPVLDLTEQLYKRAIGDGFGDCDIAAISASMIGRWPQDRVGFDH